MKRWLVFLLASILLASCQGAASADDQLPSTVQYRVEGKSVSLHVPDTALYLGKGEYWLVQAEDPITVEVIFPFQPTEKERQQLEEHIRTSLQRADLQSLLWKGNRVVLHLLLRKESTWLEFGSWWPDVLQHEGLDRGLYLEGKFPYQIMAVTPAGGGPRAVTLLNLPPDAVGVGPVVTREDFLMAAGGFELGDLHPRTFWSWTPGAGEASVIPGLHDGHTAFWLGKDLLWVKGLADTVVNTATGTVTLAGFSDVALGSGGERAEFQLVLPPEEMESKKGPWRVTIYDADGREKGEWDLFEGEPFELNYRPSLKAWWGEDGIYFTPYAVEATEPDSHGAGRLWWSLARVNPDTGEMETLADPVPFIAFLGDGQYLLEDESGLWYLWRPGKGLTDLSRPAPFKGKAYPHSAWGDWMVLYGEFPDESGTTRSELVLWHMKTDKEYRLGPGEPLGWKDGTFYWLQRAD
ncbi:MAG: hypothetical protein KM310_11710 [Clostridiales bacterium]|nr:hypothetical protein [Clostridiales bacterium]